MKNILIILLLLSVQLKGQIFSNGWRGTNPPPACSQTYEGYGTASTVYSGGTVTHVTNSNNTGAGSLHAALSLGSNRRIVFDQNTTISNFRWDSSSEIDLTNIVIDGSGFTVTINNNNNASAFNFEGSGNHDIVFKNIRIRGNAGLDCITITDGAYNFIIDHCSFSGSHDGLVDITAGSHNVTVQYCIFGGGSTDWSGSMLIAYTPTKDNSIHHNLFIPATTAPGVGERCPLIHSSNGSPGSDLLADVRNNLVYKFGRDNGTGSGFGSLVQYAGTANFINNYYWSGGTTPGNAVVTDGSYGSTPAGSAYVNGNVSGNAGVDPNTESNHALFTVPPQYIPTTQSACDAAALVLDCAGAQPLDATDAALVASVTLTLCYDPKLQLRVPTIDKILRFSTTEAIYSSRAIGIRIEKKLSLFFPAIINRRREYSTRRTFYYLT